MNYSDRLGLRAMAEAQARSASERVARGQTANEASSYTGKSNLCAEAPPPALVHSTNVAKDLSNGIDTQLNRLEAFADRLLGSMPMPTAATRDEPWADGAVAQINLCNEVAEAQLHRFRALADRLDAAV